MNQRDLHNLQFLLASSQADIEQWYKESNDDDHHYAMALLQQALTALCLDQLTELDQVAEQDLSAAQAVLARFRL